MKDRFDSLRWLGGSVRHARGTPVFACRLAIALVASAPSPALSQGLYSDEALARGVDYYVAQGMFAGGGQFGCGVALVDLDGDGDDDIVVSGAQDDRLGFFRNDGTGHFTDVSLATGLGLVTRASGIAAGDYDGDGDLDLAVTRWIKSTALLRNDGNMQFTDVSAAAGVTGAGAGAGCAWADFDGDGWIDLAVANRTGTLYNNSRNRLFRNNGNGTFTDVAQQLGVDNGGWPAFMVSWCDLDLDGDQDLYVANDKGTTSPFTNRLFRNNGDGTFLEDIGCRADVRADAMGTAFGDLTHDGVPEIYVSNVHSGNFLLYSQDIGQTYISVAEEAGVECNVMSWGAVLFDVNSDGRQDIFVASQTTEDHLFLQGPQWPLLDAAPIYGLADPGVGYCMAIGDIDRDGDPDLLLQNHLAPIALYVNNAPPLPDRRWVEFSVRGRGANTHGIGTRLVATVPDGAGGTRKHWCEVAAGSAYKSQSTYRQRMGLGNIAVVPEVEVAFPQAGEWRAAVRLLRNVPTNIDWPVWPPEALGDADGDGVRSDSDRAQIVKVVGSACTPALARHDVDGDSDITAADIDAFDRVQCDLDGDGVVGPRDITILLTHWGGARADFDASGATDSADLARLLARWSR